MVEEPADCGREESRFADNNSTQLCSNHSLEKYNLQLQQHTFLRQEYSDYAL